MSTEVIDNTEASRFEIHVDGRTAGFAAYHSGPGEIVFTHTEVGDEYGGQGVGSALARGALDDVWARGLAVVPRCPFIKSWIARHPDYEDLVAS